MYNAEGFYEPNERSAYTVNNITGVPNPDGSITVRFGNYPAEVPNAIPITEGWNYLVRLLPATTPKSSQGNGCSPSLTT